MIGEMRNRVIVQVMSPTTDAGGGQSISWGTATTVWAKVENLSGSETFFGDQLEARSNYKFTIKNEMTSYKYIGNAVPPLLAYLIADKVEELLRKYF